MSGTALSANAFQLAANAAIGATGSSSTWNGTNITGSDASRPIA
jgi:hypothetical protein